MAWFDEMQRVLEAMPQGKRFPCKVRFTYAMDEDLGMYRMTYIAGPGEGTDREVWGMLATLDGKTLRPSQALPEAHDELLEAIDGLR